MIVIIWILVAACSTDSDPSTSTIPVESASIIEWEPGSKFELPAQRYLPMYGTTAGVEFDKALDQYLSECAFEKGVMLDVPARGISGDPNQRRYGILDPVAANQHGYHLIQSDNSASLEEFQAGLTADQNQVIGDIEDPDSCVAQMAAELTMVDDKRWEDVDRVQELNFPSLQLALEHPSVRVAAGEWATCFSESTGESANDPFEAITRGVAGDFGDREIEIANADLRCKQTSGWTSVILAAETAIQNKFISEQPQVFENALSLQLEVMDNASFYLSSS